MELEEIELTPDEIDMINELLEKLLVEAVLDQDDVWVYPDGRVTFHGKLMGTVPRRLVPTLETFLAGGSN